MVLGLLMREQEERRLVFDFEMLLPDDTDMQDDGTDPSGRKDFKRGTVVCRHWLRGLCMKGDNCEFLHQYDMSKMPECRWGMECQVPECPFRHVPDEERVECAFYRQGFCSHGPNCRYRHIKLAREECPETADFSLQSKVADEENVKRRKSQPVNEFFKIAICKHWAKMGSCPFNDDCHFAHGEKELRPFPKGDRDMRDGGGGRQTEAPAKVGGNGPAPVSAHPSPPVMPDDGRFCKYFLVHSRSYHNVAHGVHFNQWSLPRELLQALKIASETCDDVFLFLTVTPSKHFQAIMRLTPGSLVSAGADEGEDLSSATVPYQTENKVKWSGAFSVEWLRICECPWERLAQFENKNLPVEQTPNGHELDPEIGQALVRLLFHQPQIQLHYRSVEDEEKLQGGAEELATRRREAAESVFGGPPPKWNITTPGFVFGCNNSNIDECFGRMLFGLSSDQEALAVKNISPGTPLFLLNLSDNHLLGIFEALSPAIVNMVPGAFALGSQTPSPLPVQVRFAIGLNAPAISASDPQIRTIVGENGVHIGPLTQHVTQRLADVFSERCGPMFGRPPNSIQPPPVPIPSRGSDQQFRRPQSGATSTMNSSSSGSVRGCDGVNSGFTEKMLVGIEPDNEFGVTRRIIGPAGSHMKRISQEAGGGAKIKVRGRGSGSKESTEDEANEPLMIIVSAENERSFRIACELTSQLLNNIHRDYQMFRQRQDRGVDRSTRR